MSEWNSVKLHDCTHIIMGQSPDSSSYNEEFKGLAFLQGCGDFGAKYPRTKISTTIPNKLAPPESILISVRAPVGDLNTADKQYCIGRGLASIVAKEGILHSRFLYYSLLWTKRVLKQLGQGSTFEAINSSDLKNHSIELPSLSIQRKIASILSTVDGQIEKTEAIIAKYQAVKQGLLQDLFTRGIDVNTGQVRPHPADAPNLYKPSPLGLIPKEWEVVGLKVIGETETPYLKTGPFGSSLKISDWVDDGVPVITIGSLGDNTFIESELLMITQAKAEELSGYQLDVGDIVFSRVADVGRSLVIKDSQKGWVMSSNFMRIRLNAKLYNPDFLQLVIKYSDGLQRQQSQFVNANGRTVVNSSTLNSFLFPKPTLTEQEKILMRIMSLNAVSSNAKQTLAKLQLLKQGLMQDLLSGNVPVTA